MANRVGVRKLSSDSKDCTRDISYENELPVDETDFNDPEEFVDRISDDGLWHVFTVHFML